MSPVLWYDLITNITTGYILTDFDSDSDFNFFNYIYHQFLVCPHPLLIPVLIAKLALKHKMREIATTANQMLQEVERETGFFVVKNRDEPKTRDYQALVKKLGKAHAYYLSAQTSIQATKLVIQSHIKHFKCLDTSPPNKKQHKL